MEKKLNDELIIEKILRSLTPKFEYIILTLVKSKDLSTISNDELMGLLQAHEQKKLSRRSINLYKVD